MTGWGETGEDVLPLPVFVYGTLRPGDAGFAEAGLEGRVDRLGPALVRGTLHDLGEYPGIVLGGTGLVTGELLLPRDSGVLSLLDEYEIYEPDDPKGSEYLRVRTETVASGTSVWIYVYNRSVTDMPVIDGGDWMAFRSRTPRLPPLGTAPFTNAFEVAERMKRMKE